MSLKKALELLLDGKCYHMWEMCGPENILKRKDHAVFWERCLDGKHAGGLEIVNFLSARGYM